MARRSDTAVYPRSDTAHRQTWTDLSANGDFIMQSTAVINGVEYATITAPVITRALLPGKTLSVGNCIAGTLKLTVLTNDVIPKSAQVLIKARIADGDGPNDRYSDWYEFGTFWIDKRVENNGLIDLECYDAMLKGNQPYVDNSEEVNWPKSMQTVVTRIAEQMGVQIDPRTVIYSGDEYVISKPNDEDTLLDLLKWIGEIHGGNWTITPENKLRLVPLVFQRGETFSIVDTANNQITGEEGDNLVWEIASESVNIAGGRQIDVPVVTGDIKTFGSGDTEYSRNLGEYTFVSGMYTSSKDCEAYFRGIVGNGVDAEQTTENYYSAASSNVVVFKYSMACDIPDDAIISRVYCQVNGHAESVTASNEKMCVQLVSGSTNLSEKYNFKDYSATNTTITIECNSIPTVQQVRNMEMQCELGYYGGAINGATVYVEYTQKGMGGHISRVTMIVDAESQYTAGTNSGIELVIEGNPCATQSMCNAVLARVGGVIYKPYEMTSACYDPAAELGDWVVAVETLDPENPVVRVDSVIYTEAPTLDVAFRSDIASPGEDELESEYPYQSPVKKTQYTVERLNKENVVMKSEIRQTQEQLTLKVTAGDVESIIEQNADSIRLKATSISWDSTYSSMSADGHLTCTGATINGTITSEYTSGTGTHNKLEITDSELRFYRNGVACGAIYAGLSTDAVGRISIIGGGNGVYIGANTNSIALNSSEIELYGNINIRPTSLKVLNFEAFDGAVYLDTQTLTFLHGILVKVEVN